MANRQRRWELTIGVEAYKGERLFAYGATRFDVLDGLWFNGGELRILRGGRILDRTSAIDWVGTHAAHPCFCGLRRIFPRRGDARSWATSTLAPEHFRMGDVIAISAPARAASFSAFLRHTARAERALRDALREHPRTTVGELRAAVAKAVARRALDPSVLRFREGERVVGLVDR